MFQKGVTNLVLEVERCGLLIVPKGQEGARRFKACKTRKFFRKHVIINIFAKNNKKINFSTDLFTLLKVSEKFTMLIKSIDRS